MFLDQVKDVLRFASLGMIERDIRAQFKVDYLNANCATGFYHRDWVVVFPPRVSGAPVGVSTTN